MQKKQVILFILLMIFSSILRAKPLLPMLDLKPSIKKSILKHEIYATSNVSSTKLSTGKKGQSLSFTIAGLHPKSCNFALKKLSRYEIYKNHISFINESLYNDDMQKTYFELKSKLLPFKMVLSFKIPRIKKPGKYPFSFDKGFLKGLTGTISVFTYKNKCLFYTKASWLGPHSGIPNFVFEMFSKTLSKIAMENLFRMSKSLKQ